jgi:PAS domain S-box-containing protein
VTTDLPTPTGGNWPAGLTAAALDAIPVAIWLCALEGEVLHANRRARAYFDDLPPGSTLSQHWQRLRLRPSDESPDLSWYAPGGLAQAAQAGIRDLELCQASSTGSPRWFLFNAEPLPEQGPLAGTLLCFQDITAQKAAQLEQSQSRERLRAIVATTPECVKVVAADGRLLQMNPAGLAMIGADDAESVEGHPVLELIAPEHREIWQSCHQRICAGERLNWEFDIIGLGGIRRHMETHAVPLRLPDGTLSQLAVTRDISEHKRARQALLASEKHWRELLEALPMAVYTTDDHGVITFFNAAAAKLWMGTPECGVDTWYTPAKLLDTHGIAMPLAESPMALALKTETQLQQQEAIIERQDGSRVPIAVYPTPLFDSRHQLIGAVNMLVDISPHRQAQQRQSLLIDELNHRVKNTLASVQSIAALTLLKSDSLQAFREKFEPRLIALSRAHDQLTRSHWQSAPLRELLEDICEPYRCGERERIQMKGPEIELSPRQALSLAMVIHELAVNAAKYGALTHEDGFVRLSWTLESGGKSLNRLQLAWSEHQGPAASVPTRRGFGSRLIETSVTKELKGHMQVAYTEQGFNCVLDIPLR